MPRTRQRPAAAPARRVRYQVAASLDGRIAGPNGEADWIPMDPDMDFDAMFSLFDTVLMGRRSFERIGHKAWSGLTTYVFSRTLNPADYPGVTVVADRVEETVSGLRASPGKDIWLFGGGDLFRSLAAMHLVDRVELAIVPTLLGQGVPLLPEPAGQVALALTGHRVYEKSGIVMLEYDVKGLGTPPA